MDRSISDSVHGHRHRRDRRWSAGSVWSCPSRRGRLAEDRLAGLMGDAAGQASQEARPFQRHPGAAGRDRPGPSVLLDRMVPNAENLNLLYEQADVSFSFNRFMIVVGGLGMAGAIFGLVFDCRSLRRPAGGGCSGVRCRSSG